MANRSTHTNALIRAIFGEAHNQALVYNEDTGEYDEVCNGFRALADCIDNLDQVTVKILNKYTGEVKGFFYLMMMNDGEEQISDYTSNEWCERIIKGLYVTGDE